MNLDLTTRVVTFVWMDEMKEADGMTLTNLCASKEARDAMLNYGADAGAKIAWDRLAELPAGA